MATLEFIKYVVLFGGLGLVGLIILYTIFRALFSAIFKSYFEEKDKHLIGGNDDEER